MGSPVIGTSNGMLSSYCYTIMSITIFFLFKPTSTQDFLYKFFSYYSRFPWEAELLTIKGGVPFEKIADTPPSPKVNSSKQESMIDR